MNDIKAQIMAQINMPPRSQGSEPTDFTHLAHRGARASRNG
ncbi:MAG: hypothetical protein ABI155_16380 [Paralcaligenes sp.]